MDVSFRGWQRGYLRALKDRVPIVLNLGILFKIKIGWVLAGHEYEVRRSTVNRRE